MSHTVSDATGATPPTGPDASPPASPLAGSPDGPPPGEKVALDRQDERFEADSGLSGAWRAFVKRVRAGDIGSLPVVVGLIIVWTVFQSINSVFLSSTNLVNLALECCATGVIALGIVCVLLVGEIDLSVGSVSGLSAAILAVLFVNHHVPVILAIVVAMAVGVAIGLLYATLFNRLGMPSFVSTLSGLLAFLGLQLYVLNDETINLDFKSSLVQFAQNQFVSRPVAYVIAAIPALAIFYSDFRTSQARTKAGLTGKSLSIVVAKAAAIFVVLEIATWYLNRDRGIGWMFVLFVLLVVAMNYAFTRTSWGRSIFAVGGNAEAARRSGIKVDRVYLSAFMLCSGFAALGGVLTAARLGASGVATGAGDVNLTAIAAAVIGGTSLFGGRGTAYSALLGIIVIQSIQSGLTLMNLPSSSYRYIITGIVLALAVAVDSLARKSRASHGAG